MPTTAVLIKMRNRCFLLVVVMLFCGFALATTTLAAEPASHPGAHEGVSLKPQMLVQLGGFGITNSMLVTWIVAAGIIVLAQIATRRVKPIPSGIQNFWEWLVEGLHSLLARSDFDSISTECAQLSVVRKYLCRRKHSRSDVHDGSVAVADPADSVLFPRSACGICSGARFHAADCGFHNVDCGTPGGTGARALIFGDLMTRSQNQLRKI